MAGELQLGDRIGAQGTYQDLPRRPHHRNHRRVEYIPGKGHGGIADRGQQIAKILQSRIDDIKARRENP